MLKSSFTRLSSDLLKNVLKITAYDTKNFCVIKNKNEQEVNLINKLKTAFPDSTKIDVIDVSGVFELRNIKQMIRQLKRS